MLTLLIHLGYLAYNQKNQTAFIPKPEYVCSYPALPSELKWNKHATAAITQIKEKQYPPALKQCTGDILLIGINYDKKSKTHQCVIKELNMVKFHLYKQKVTADSKFIHIPFPLSTEG